MEHIYKPTIMSWIIPLIAVPLLVGFGITSGMHGHPANNATPLFILVPLILVVGAACLNVATEVVRVTDDGIERKTLFSSKRIPIGEIGGWKVRWHSNRSGSYYSLQILPKDVSLYKPVEVSNNIRVDEYFKSWVMKFPNMTAHGGLMGSFMDSPKFQARFGDTNDPKVKTELDKLTKFKIGNLDITPEKMVENYFAQSGL